MNERCLTLARSNTSEIIPRFSAYCIFEIYDDYNTAFCELRPGMHNPQPAPGPRTCYIRPSEQVKKYKKLLLNGDFMNEFKLH